jgi:hypothetical protein
MLLLGPVSLAQASGCHTEMTVSEQALLLPYAGTQGADEPELPLPNNQAVQWHNVASPDECNACDLRCLQSCASACAVPLAMELSRADAATQAFAALHKRSRPSHTLPLLRPPTLTL